MLFLQQNGKKLKNVDAIRICPLFQGIAEADVPSMLKCLNAQEKAYRKNEYIFKTGESPVFVGVVLSGSVHVVREDYWGNRTILTSVEPGNLFGEAFSCAEATVLPVSVIAREDTTVLLLDYRKIITTCPTACTFHARLVQNMLKILANKNMMLTQKMDHITKKTTKEKVLSYLSEQAFLAGSNRFTIPFNRQELADYLSVERSALSGTLSKMKQEGTVDYWKNSFRLTSNDQTKE